MNLLMNLFQWTSWCKHSLSVGLEWKLGTISAIPCQNKERNKKYVIETPVFSLWCDVTGETNKISRHILIQWPSSNSYSTYICTLHTEPSHVPSIVALATMTIVYSLPKTLTPCTPWPGRVGWRALRGIQETLSPLVPSTITISLW